MFTRCTSRGTASDIASLRRAWTECDMRVKMRRIVMQSVGIADGIARMKLLGKFPHHFFQTGMEDLIRINSNGKQGVVLLARHRKDEAMCNDRSLCPRRKPSKVQLPCLGNAPLALGIGKLCGSRAAPIGIPADVVMQKSSGMNLSERFPGGIVGKAFELLTNLLLHLGTVAK